MDGYLVKLVVHCFQIFSVDEKDKIHSYGGGQTLPYFPPPTTFALAVSFFSIRLGL
jgi:CRISPR/Cas system-associated protein Cas5 (RAMP superfamily)